MHTEYLEWFEPQPPCLKLVRLIKTLARMQAVAFKAAKNVIFSLSHSKKGRKLPRWAQTAVQRDVLRGILHPSQSQKHNKLQMVAIQ